MKLKTLLPVLLALTARTVVYAQADRFSMRDEIKKLPAK